jgi:hypothetical protein
VRKLNVGPFRRRVVRVEFRPLTDEELADLYTPEQLADRAERIARWGDPDPEPVEASPWEPVGAEGRWSW